MARGAKYKIGEPSRAQKALSEKEEKFLARLVRKHGREEIAKAVQSIKLGPGPGRPKRGLLPYYEDMHLADWIEQRRERYRRLKGRRVGGKLIGKNDLFLAVHDLYKMRELLEGRPPGNFDKFFKTTKKKFHRGRRGLEVEKKIAAAIQKGRQ